MIQQDAELPFPNSYAVQRQVDNPLVPSATQTLSAAEEPISATSNSRFVDRTASSIGTVRFSKSVSPELPSPETLDQAFADLNLLTFDDDALISLVESPTAPP